MAKAASMESMVKAVREWAQVCARQGRGGWDIIDNCFEDREIEEELREEGCTSKRAAIAAFASLARNLGAKRTEQMAEIF